MAFDPDLSHLRILSIEEIQRRLTRMVGEKDVPRPHEITRRDLARWLGVDLMMIRRHQTGLESINDTWQIMYSRFFALIDGGFLVLDPNAGRKKQLIRVTPTAPPKKKLLPRIAFGGEGPQLKFDPT